MATDSVLSQPLPSPSDAHIVRTPGVCEGRPRIAGSRISVDRVVLDHERASLSPDEIASRYEGLTLSDVYAALAYYYDHLDEIRALIAADDLLAAEMSRRSQSMVEKKLRPGDGQGDSLSSG